MLVGYIVCLIVGGVLVLLSALTGHGDHEIAGGHDLGGGHDMHLGQEGDPAQAGDIWLPFLSLRFWTYGITGFGLAGTLLMLLAKQGSSESLPWSIGTGLVAGFLVALLTRLATKGEADSSTKTADMLGHTGTAIVPIRADLPGKVRLIVKGDLIEMLALSHDGETIPADTEVVILTVENDRARVVAKSTLMD